MTEQTPADRHAQDEVLDFLSADALGSGTERIDTHGAFVFLSKDRAYKLKRAVAYSFMDFSSLEKRRRAIEAELTLNRRTAPELYRRVLPVTREQDGSLALDGGGEPVEWLLEMCRFPADAQLDHVSGRGDLNADLVSRLARNVAAFHASAEVRRDRGGYLAMDEVVVGNEGDFAKLVPSIFEQAQVESLCRFTRLELDRHRNLLEVRREQGRVRHCHGDLHLANLVLLDGEPVPFDCIEFSEEIACIDVLYDVAFLVMDLLERRFRDEARLFLQGYNDIATEDEGMALMPLFLSIRAAIRAKVAGFSADISKGGKRDEEADRARTYLALAERLLRPAPPRLIVIAGRSGTGKSSVARAVAPSIDPEPGALVLRSDVMRKRLFGKKPTERLPPEAYAPEVSQRVFGEMAGRARVLLRAGRSVICDAVYGLHDERAEIERVARQENLPFLGIWLEAEERLLEDRVTRRTGDASDAGISVVRKQRAAVDQRDLTWSRVDAGRPLDEVVDDVRRKLGG